MDNSLCPVWANNLIEAQYLILNHTLYNLYPRCSQDKKMHEHYFCPKNFGITEKRISKNSPIGIQNLCAKCKSNKKGLHDGVLTCLEAIQQGGHIISEIRILPMSTSVFPSYEDMMKFITHVMPLRGGKYYYIKSKMVVEKTSFVLFQYSNMIIGSAICTGNYDVEAFKFEGVEYRGYYQFDVNSIRFFKSPITKEEFQSIDSEFKGFNQTHQKIHLGLLPSIFQLIENSKAINVISDNKINDELTLNEILTVKEGAKKQIVVNAYERNPVAKSDCIKYYKYINKGKLKCEICGFDFSSKYGIQFEDKIHVHHIVEISTIGKEYEVNPVKDLIPVCPNCHMIIHSKKPAYTPEEVKKMIEDNKD